MTTKKDTMMGAITPAPDGPEPVCEPYKGEEVMLA